ncbi:ALK and LTK ligand 2-like [Scleropages formosus]|uniref:ALK and LTK ligand 2a n=1 Tax=Scleropages formosus TaxID=113540 RepID=A0A8C9SFD9_SCLFO|nr:ALK and LTK ligand 2 [Scleropages formosus]
MTPGPRARALLGLAVLLWSAGACRASAPPAEQRDDKSLFERILDIVKRAKERQGEGGESFGAAKPEQSAEGREPQDYKSYNEEEHVVEIFPRDLRKKEKFLKHLTGPLYFSPKCRKHVYRLYHNTRDCTIPAYYKRCARLLTRLAGSARCTEG